MSVPPATSTSTVVVYFLPVISSHIITFLARLTRANTCHAILIYRFYHQLTMSKGIRKVVDRIREDVCKDCENKCGLCEHGVCQDVVIEVGCFFIHCAEHEEKE